MYLDDMKFIETHFGGNEAEAATAVGVNRTTWYRWKRSQRNITRHCEKLLALVAEKLRQEEGDAGNIQNG